MAKQEMRDKTDDHESVQGQASGSSTVPTISVILGIVSFGMIGLSVPLFMTYVIGMLFLALIMQIVASVMGGVGLTLGIKESYIYNRLSN